MTMLRAIALATSLAAALAAAPCTAPPGIVPALNESLCYQEVLPTNPSGVSIRQYGASLNATFAAASGRGAYPQGIQAAIAGVINYFAGANDDQLNILSARTVPFVINPAGGWTAYLEVSPTQFPDNFLIPRPNPGASLEKVNDVVGLVAVFQYNTTGFPFIEYVQEACGAINNSTLPPGYAFNDTSPVQTLYAFYNGQGAANYTSECWMTVYKV